MPLRTRYSPVRKPRGRGLEARFQSQPRQREGEEEFVDGGGLDGGRRRVGEDEGAGVFGEAVHHVDAPGEGGVDAVVAVAGEQAADAAYSIADSRGGGGEVQHAEGGAAAGEAVGLGERCPGT